MHLFKMKLLKLYCKILYNVLQLRGNHKKLYRRLKSKKRTMLQKSTIDHFNKISKSISEGTVFTLQFSSSKDEMKLPLYSLQKIFLRPRQTKGKDMSDFRQLSQSLEI